MKNSAPHVSRLRRRLWVRLSFLTLCGAGIVFVASSHAGKQIRPVRVLSSFLSNSRTPPNGSAKVSDERRLSTADETAKANLLQQYGNLPLNFEINEGQTDQQVKFLSRGPGYDLFLTAGGAVLTLRKSPAVSLDTLRRPPWASESVNVSAQPAAVLRLKMIGANGQVVAEGQDEMPGKVNYFIGNDPASWHTNIPTYRRVNYREIYSGVDMIYYGNQRELEYDFVIASGADPNVIRFRIDGANRITLDKSGDLQLIVNDGTVTLHKPGIYQLASDGNRREVKGQYVIKGNEIGFKVKTFDSRKSLIIDPVLSYSTLLGAGGNEYAYGIAVDSSGSAYVTGATDVSSFPTTAGAFQTSSTTGGAFVTKLDPTGSNLIYLTYLSGSSGSIGTAIAVDSSGNAYVTGSTSSPDFPSVNAIRGAYNFVKSVDSGTSWVGKNLSPPRNINSIVINPQLPSTIYAGTSGSSGVYKSIDSGNTWTPLSTGVNLVAALAIDPVTPSTIYAATNAPNFGVIKSTNGGTSWVSLSGLSGTGGTYSLAIDPVSPSTLYLGSNGGLFKTTNGGTSWTRLNAFPTTAFAIAIDPSSPMTIYAAGGFVYKSTDGGTSWSNSSSGLPSTTIRNITIDPSTPATLYAGTNSGVFKSINGAGSWSSASSGLGSAGIVSLALNSTAPAIIYAGSSNGKIFKTSNAGANWSQSYSSIPSISVNALAIDPVATANVYAGTSATGSGNSEAFLAKLNDTGSGLIYSTFLGGTGADFGYGIALDSSRNVYVTGSTSSSDFLTASPFQANSGGNNDAFILKVNSNGDTLLYSTYLGGSGFESAYAIAVDNGGNAYVTGTTSSANFPTASAFQSAIGDQFSGDAFVTKLGNTGTLVYSTYLGGNGIDTGYGIAADSTGNAYVTGLTTSSNFPTANPIQPTNGGSAGDAFVTKLNNLGTGLVYSTYLGGSNVDSGRGIAVDSTGNAFVTGYTGSAEFPVIAGALRTKSPLFKTSNGGSSWSSDNYGLKSDIVTSLAINPSNPSVIYAGTRSGVYKSTDGGRNWNSSSTGLVRPSVVGLAIDPVTPTTVYLAAIFSDFSNSSGVYKSTDSGATWNPANTGLGNSGVSALAVDRVTPTTLYAAQPSGIFKTINGGNSWSASGSAIFSVSAIVVDPVTPNTIYVSANSSGGGVFKSNDGGANWQAVNNGLTTTFILCLAVDPSTPSTVYAGANGGLFKSMNGGISWTAINNGLSSLFVSAIVIDPVTSTSLYAASSSFSGGVFKSTNGGNNWTAINNELRYSFVSSLAINPAKTSTIYAGTNVFPPDDDAFVLKVNPAGTALIYSTFLGGRPASGDSSNINDEGYAIAIDSAGNTYVSGISRSPDFPVTSDSYQPFNRGFSDAFVTKLTMSYIISGQVLDGSNAPVSGAEVTLSDSASLRSILTESDGSYQFSGLREGGNFTVSATKPHFTMAPSSQTFNNLNSNQTVNFTATATAATFHSISGQVTNSGVGLSGVTVTLSGSQPGVRTTDSNGNYSFTLADGGNYTVTPSILGFTFSPPGQTFNNLSADQTANFNATRQNFVVTNANDHGTGSLRQAILNANATSGADTITFNIPGSGVQTINLLIGLPDITDPVTIDATTQPGYAGVPLIELNGTQAGSNANGLKITSGNCTIRGLVINKFSSNAGIFLSGNGGNVIQGNYIGVDPTGTIGRNNNNGITISGSSNLIGGTTASARNVISGNGFYGISVGGANNQIQGNYIGTNASGTAAVPNGINGVEISGSPTFTNNLIGGTAAGAGNLISGNQRGVNLFAPGNTVQGNRIGTDASGTQAIGNGVGVSASAANSIVGGTVPGARNIISGNTGDGVDIGGAGSLLQGNFIGTDITGTLALGNGGSGVVVGNSAIVGGTTPAARNVISANGGFGNVSLGSNSSGNGAIVQGNYVGTDVTGNVALTNPQSGISISGSNNLIGGVIAGAANLIAGNRTGIEIGSFISSAPIGNTIQGNVFGLNALGNVPLPNAQGGIILFNAMNTTIGGDQSEAANKIVFSGGPGLMVSSGTGNVIRGNAIFSNNGLGIDLGSLAGITPNDTNDADIGANNLQNFPVLTMVSSSGGSTTIQGTLNSKPNTTFRIDFYSNAACDPSGNGEGGRFFDTTNVTTDANGNASINFVSSMSLPAGKALTATATDPSGNTSEFSPCDSTNLTGSVQFSSASYYVLEDVGNAVVKILRVGGSKGALSINYTTADGTATAGSDYSSVSGTLVFADGETSKTISIPIANDGITEPDETVRLSITASDLETLGSQPILTIVIQGNNTPLVLTAGDVDVLEGNSGTTNAVVTVNLSAQTSRTVMVNYASVAGSATSGVDFTPVSGMLTFAPGEITQTISVPIIGDTLNEFNETLQVALSNPVNATVGFSSTVRILNDDPLPALSISDVNVIEGNAGTTNAVFNINLSAPSGKTVTVFYNTANGTATAGGDYVTSSGSISFTPSQTGKTITVQINGDTAIEPNETFFVNLFSPTNATISKAMGTGTILDDDGQVPLQLMMEDSASDPNQLAAVDALVLVRDPFHVLGIAQWFPLGSDRNTRVMIFVNNLQLNQGETAAAVEITLANGTFSNTIFAEDVRPVANTDFAQVIFRLPDNLPIGVCTVTVKAHGQLSNSGIIHIVQ